MTRLILCIDDQPIRYRKLRELTDHLVVTTCRMEDFKEYIRYPFSIHGICLDHDMPFQDGMWFANELKHYNIPVVVTSVNPRGAANILSCLQEYETPCAKLSCTIRGWEEMALEFLNDHN